MFSQFQNTHVHPCLSLHLYKFPNEVRIDLFATGNSLNFGIIVMGVDVFNKKVPKEIWTKGLIVSLHLLERNLSLFSESFKLIKQPCSFFITLSQSLSSFVFISPPVFLLFSLLFTLYSQFSLSLCHLYFSHLSPSFWESCMALKYIDFRIPFLFRSPLLLSFASVAPSQHSCPTQPLMLHGYLWHQLTGSTELKLELFHPHLLSFVLQYGYPGGHSAASQY